MQRTTATGTVCEGLYDLAGKNPEFDRVEQTILNAMDKVAGTCRTSLLVSLSHSVNEKCKNV